MSDSIDIEKWLRDSESVAAIAPADALFGLLTRSFTVPGSFAARVTRKSGDATVCAPGNDIAADGVSEVLFVRAQPFVVSFRAEELPAQDKYLCDAQISFQVRILPEKSELDSFRERVMGSRSTAAMTAIEKYLHAAVLNGLRSFVQRHPVEHLLGSKGMESAADALTDELRGPCFSGGMTVESNPDVRFASDSYVRVRQVEQDAVRELQEHRVKSELRDAIAGAQRDKLEHLESMLNRLNSLADESPEVGLPDLMKAFDEAQRGELYQALFETGARRRATRWIVVVAGQQIIYFDPQSPATPIRQVKVEGPAGQFRSVRLARSDAGHTLLVGASRGVYELSVDGTEPERTYLFEQAEGVRGGINAAALNGNDLVATHSERGVLHWLRDESAGATQLLPDFTGGASAVRNAQFAASRFWCSVDEKILSVPTENLFAPPDVIDLCSSVISSLCVDDDGCHAGTSEGEIWSRAISIEGEPRLIHAGGRRAAESVGVVRTGGISRLYFTDTSLAVFTRVIGDTFVCRYEAGGQTIRRAQVADDCVVATNDARDRVFLWTPENPRQPVAILPVSQLTGRSVQDVCLVPVL